ncbi:uncharacterized protein LOC120331424 [Styela clava]
MNNEAQEQKDQGWSLSYGRKAFYAPRRPQDRPMPSARHGINRWRIEPRSIFDYDPVEDGKESLSLSYLHESHERTVYEGYGKRQFHRAREDNSLGIEEYFDPAHDNKPSLVSFHPSFRPKTAEPQNDSDSTAKITESGSNISDNMKTAIESQAVEEIANDTPDFGSNSLQTSTGLRSFVYSPIPFGYHEFVPPEVPIYTNFNRVPTPFTKK